MPKFKDLLKAPSDLLGDDFTSKKTIKFKAAAAGITFSSEETLKTKGTSLLSVDGKVGAPNSQRSCAPGERRE